MTGNMEQMRQEAALTAMANVMLSRLGVGQVLRASVRIADADTASTDGWGVTIPPVFLGMSTATDSVLAVGLMAHELGHFLQPLQEITEVEERERVPHWLTNIALDIQGESMVEWIVPGWRANLAYTRFLVWKAHGAEYRAGVDNAKSFADAAPHAALWARFVFKESPFYDGSLYRWPTYAGGTRLAAFIESLGRWKSLTPQEIPAALERLIRDFPELRDNNADIVLPFPSPVRSGSKGKTKGIAIQLPPEVMMNTAGSRIVGEASDVMVADPKPEAVRLSRAFSVRWTRKNAGEILAPGRLDRLADARGDDIPYRMTIPRGRSAPQPKVVIAVDKSGSMREAFDGSQSKIDVAHIAAQALALAVRRAGGQVVGVMFNSTAITTGDDLILFGRANPWWRAAGGTSFTFLPDVWSRWPDYEVILITDGDGEVPLWFPRDRERTTGIVIPDGKPDIAAEFCKRVFVVDTAADLPGVLASAVPRSTVAH